jgi:hypothetical protein
MTSLPHEPTPVQTRRAALRLPEMWASIAISVIWLAVVVAAIWGPDLTTSTPGGTESTVPSSVPLAAFAFGATWVIARYGFRRDQA